MDIVKIIFVFFSFLIALSVKGQTTSIWQEGIDTIELRGKTIHPFAIKHIALKSRTEESTLRTLENSSLIVQSNGPGLLATPLIHGMGARHTAILWNGINIQSPVNGTFDLNLIQDNTSITYIPTSASPSIGSAALGGALIINPNDTQDESINLSLSNLENIRLNGRKGVKIGKFSLMSSASFRIDENRYEFRSNGGNEVQENARLEGKDFQLQSRYEDDTWQISSSFWGQKYSREIASSKTARYTGALQKDENYRWQTSFTSNTGIFGQVGWMREKIIYEDRSVFSEAKNEVLLSSLGYKFKGSEAKFNFRQDETKANFFADEVSRQQVGISLRREQKLSDKFDLALISRYERIGGENFPFLFDLSLKYKMSDAVAWVASIDRSYNLPTFNDLFWPTGGNENLQAEQSLGGDLTLKVKKKRWTLNSLIYYKKVKNWILWSPGPMFWSPSNQQKVINLGLDLDGKYLFELSKIRKIAISGNLQWNRTIVEENEQNPTVIGKQLIYIPKIRGNFSAEWEENRTTIRIEGLYTGERNITFDNQEKIEDYLIMNAHIGFEFNPRLKTVCSINNLLNKDYEHIAFYAMPLRNFKLTFTYNIK